MGRCKRTGKAGKGEKKADGARASSLCLVCDDEWDGEGRMKQSCDGRATGMRRVARLYAVSLLCSLTRLPRRTLWPAAIVGTIIIIGSSCLPPPLDAALPRRFHFQRRRNDSPRPGMLAQTESIQLAAPPNAVVYHLTPEGERRVEWLASPPALVSSICCVCLSRTCQISNANSIPLASNFRPRPHLHCTALHCTYGSKRCPQSYSSTYSHQHACVRTAAPKR